MSEPARRRGRTHDAEGAREAILDAAEKVFAEHGFDGARTDAIAEEAGYNKGLIFHYFDDKLGLYSAVLRRLDEQGSVLQSQLLAPLIADEQLTSDAGKFRTFLETAVRVMFDFLVGNPHTLRMLAWEAAEGWQTFRQVMSQFNTDDAILFRRLMEKAQDAGLFRPGIDPYGALMVAFATCMSYLTFTPLLEMAFEVDATSPEALVRARELIVDFVVRGLLVDPEAAKQ